MSFKQKIAHYFHFEQRQTKLKTEVLAGITTFLTAAYVIFVNPAILSTTGIDYHSAFLATCLTAAFGSLMMGLYANYPVAVAPSMGLNAYFAYVAVHQLNNSWEAGLAAVFAAGVIFLFITLIGLRIRIMDAIPYSIKLATATGIGLFLGVLGLKNAGLIVSNPVTLVTLGNLHHSQPILTIAGFCLIAALDARKVPGAILIGILVIALIGILSGITPFHGITANPLHAQHHLFSLNLKSIFELNFIVVMCTFLFVAFFDSTGTLIAIANQIGLINKEGKVENIQRALRTDSSATIVGALLGTSTVGAYIESAAGVRLGGRTGLTAVVIGILFLFAIFFSPLAKSIPNYATAAALLYVCCLMFHAITQIDWHDISESAPAVITAIAIPLTFSIASGVCLGLISYAVIQIVSGNFKKINIGVISIAVIGAIYFYMVG